jgi:hypothetical protein
MLARIRDSGFWKALSDLRLVVWLVDGAIAGGTGLITWAQHQPIYLVVFLAIMAFCGLSVAMSLLLPKLRAGNVPPSADLWLQLLDSRKKLEAQLETLDFRRRLRQSQINP